MQKANLLIQTKLHLPFTRPGTVSRPRSQEQVIRGLRGPLTQMAYFRPSNRHPSYHNLYFVGASTHPGTGLPSAMVSGRLVSDH